MAKPYLEFLGSYDLGRVYKEQIQINVKTSGSTIPFTTTSGNAEVNITGKTRIILIQGAHDGSGFTGNTQDAKLGAFVTLMESWVNTNVASYTIYYSSLYYSGVAKHYYYVIPIDFTWTRSFADPNRIIYSLMMKEVLVPT